MNERIQQTCLRNRGSRKTGEKEGKEQGKREWIKNGVKKRMRREESLSIDSHDRYKICVSRALDCLVQFWLPLTRTFQSLNASMKRKTLKNRKRSEQRLTFHTWLDQGRNVYSREYRTLSIARLNDTHVLECSCFMCIVFTFTNIPKGSDMLIPLAGESS